ncbi:MAG: hypothetical protein ACYC65_12245 [Candidatus Limnocylindrales bacterium]
MATDAHEQREHEQPTLPSCAGRCDARGRWALSSGLALAGLIGMVVFNARTPEYRENWAKSAAEARLTLGEVVGAAAYVLYMIVLVVAPIIIMLGVAPELEAALYFTYVVLILLTAGWTLLMLVFAQRLPASA